VSWWTVLRDAFGGILIIAIMWLWFLVLIPNLIEL
jgi:hypothetical protein